MFCKFASVFCVASLLMTSISANPTEEAGSLRHRRSPTVGLLSLQGQHHGHHLGEQGGHFGEGAFYGSSAQTSAGTSNVGHGPHGNSGSQSLASSRSHASTGSSNSGSHSFASSHSQAANFGSLRHRRSPTVGLLSLQGQHHGHHLGGQGGHFGGGAFLGSSAQTSAGTSNVGHGLHGNSGSQSLASSHSQAANFGSLRHRRSPTVGLLSLQGQHHGHHLGGQGGHFGGGAFPGSSAQTSAGTSNVGHGLHGNSGSQSLASSRSHASAGSSNYGSHSFASGHSQAANFGSLRHRRSPTVGLLSLQGQHHGHHLGGQGGHFGGGAFPGSSAQTSAGISNVGHGLHGNSGSQSLASSHSHASAGSSNSGSHSFASSHSQAANFGSLRHRRSPTVGLLSLQGQHHGHHLGGQGGHFGGGAFPGSSAQTSAGTSNVGHGLHGNSGSQSLASSRSHASAGSSNSGSHSFASSHSQAANFGSLRHRRSPTVGLLSLQGQHHGHHLGGQGGHFGGGAFPGSSAQTSAGTSNVGHGLHGNSGSQSLASSHSHASAGSSNSGSHSFASSHSQAANFGSLRHRRSPTVGLLSLQGQHHGHHLGGQGGHFGGGAFPGSSAQTSAGTSNVGHGLHGNSGSHSFASSRSEAANFGMSPYNAGAPAGGRNDFYGAGGYF